AVTADKLMIGASRTGPGNRRIVRECLAARPMELRLNRLPIIVAGLGRAVDLDRVELSAVRHRRPIVDRVTAQFPVAPRLPVGASTTPGITGVRRVSRRLRPGITSAGIGRE